MYEISSNGPEMLKNLYDAGNAYPNGEYDFTLKNRFLLYHCPLKNKYVYIAVDLYTGLGSEVMSVMNKKSLIKRSDYGTLVPLVLFSVKYTGDRSYTE